MTALLALSLLPAAALAQEETATILNPAESQVVAGTVTISGTANSIGFQRYEVDFGYEPNVTDTWFPIQEPVPTPQFGGTLVQWDTVALGIADGVYVLRLRVYRQDGSFLEAFAHNIILQNGFAAGPEQPGEPALPTATASPTGVFVQLPPTSTPRATSAPQPTATRAPGAAQAADDPLLNLPAFGRALTRGALWAVAAFIVLGIYTALRPRVRPHLWRWMHRLVKLR
jgi:hypothetical protein